MTPDDIPLTETLAFVSEHLPPRGARVLEIGCGTGALAAALAARGWRVVGIDSSLDAVRMARKRGVDARMVAWPQVDGERGFAEPFDAVVFSRSLHHMSSLAPAVERAASLLSPRGVVLVEDFAFADVDPRTAVWLHDELRSLDSRGDLDGAVDCFGARVLRGDGGLGAWSPDPHDGHVVHSADAMRTALAAHFGRLTVSGAPYAYRYACPLLARNERGFALAAALCQREKSLIAADVIGALGRRFVAAQGDVESRREPALNI